MDKAYSHAPEDVMNGHGFIFTPSEPTHWHMGQGKAGLRFGATALMKDGHGWDKFSPVPERQSKGNFESMACTIYASLNAWETLARYYGFKDFPRNCSDRFNAILARISPQGGSPHTSCESIRKYGVIPEEVLPFSENIHDWNEFYSPYPMEPALITLGKKITDAFTLGHEYVFNGFAKDKPTLLKKALERGPVCASVFAWKLNPLTGLYVKEAGDVDQHWVVFREYEDEKYWEILDQYPPFIKRVAWDTDFTTAKLYFLSRRDPSQELAILTQIKELCIKVIGLLQKQLGFAL